MDSVKEPENLAELLQQLRRDGVKKEDYKIHIDRFLDFKARKLGIPLSGHFELTPLCNLDCKMCYVHLNKNQLQGAEILTTDQWKEIMRQAYEAGMRKADLTGGECLTYPGFEELYLFLQSLGIEVSVKTNAVLLNEQKIAFFKAHPPSKIQVSLYGSCNEVYEAVTGFPLFDKVFQNLIAADQAGLPIKAAITPSRYLYHDIENIIKLLRSVGIPFEINSGLFTPREETGRQNEEHDLTTEEYLEILRIRDRIQERKRTPVDAASLPEIKRTGEERQGIQCAAGRSMFFVNWDGKLYACTNIKAISEDLSKISFQEAWRRINQAAMCYSVPVECSGCPYEQVCIPCVAEHEEAGRTGHCNPALCERTRRMVEEGFLCLT